MNKRYLSSIALLLSAVLFIMVPACKKPASDGAKPKATYFSIRQFANDQFVTYHSLPLAFLQTTDSNGHIDSAAINMYNMDWGAILKIFFASDIGDPKFVGQYNFNLFDDDGSHTRNYYYEAKDPSLFTRKLQIVTDQETNKVKNIYIETEDESHSQKLYYAPLKVIQIQELQKQGSGPAKRIITAYRFLM